MFATRVMKALQRWTPSELRRYAVIMVRNAIGLPNLMRTADREALEQVILPAYAARPEIQSVLFVGCDWYTRHYEKMFAGRAYATIDPDPWKRRFGARHHIVAGLETLKSHFAPASLDLIVCNGVFGWGLDSRADCEQAFEACYEALRPGGRLLLGWNDTPQRTPLPLASLASLARFRPEPFAGLPAQHMANPANRHVFNFYVKPGG